MSLFAGMGRELVALFVEDGLLAAGVLAAVALAAFLALLLHATGVIVGMVLVAGPAAILLISVLSTKRKVRP